MVVDKRVFLEGAMNKLVTETSLTAFDNRGRMKLEEGSVGKLKKLSKACLLIKDHD
jgi:hypothetical protein